MKQNKKPVPIIPNLKIQDLINIKIEKKLKELEEHIKILNERINNLENKTIISLSPLPTITPTEVKEFNHIMIRSNADSFDDLE